MPEGLPTARIVRGAVFFVGLVVVWEAAVRLFHVPDWLIPSPAQIGAVIAEKHWIVFEHTLVTLEETALGFLLAVVVAVALAIGIVYFPLLRDTLYPAIIMLNSFPKIAVAPLFVIWIGVGIEAKIANAFLLALFPIVINAILGLTDMEPELLELVRAMSRSRSVLFWKIRLPHSLPYLFAGLVGLTVIGVVFFLLIEAAERLAIPWHVSSRTTFRGESL